MSERNEEQSQREGAVDEAKGRVKEAFGALTDDEDMKREGQLDRAAADAKNRVSEAIDDVRDGIGSLLSKDDENSDEKK